MDYTEIVSVAKAKVLAVVKAKLIEQGCPEELANAYAEGLLEVAEKTAERTGKPLGYGQVDPHDLDDMLNRLAQVKVGRTDR